MSAGLDPGKRRLALAALLLVTVVWGATFFWMDQALDAAQEALGPDVVLSATALFLTMRFLLPALLLPVLVPAARRPFTDGVPGAGGALVREAGLLGLLLLAGFLVQMIALADITPAVSAFLTSLYVIFTALLSLCFAQHRHIAPALVVGVLLATLGAAFISGPPRLTFDLPEWLTVLCAALFAGTILTTDHATRRHRPAHVSLVSFWVVALGAAACLAWALARPGAPAGGAVLGLLTSGAFLVPLLSCSLLATLFALTVLNQFQRFVSPVRAATIYSLEPVWAGLISVGMGAEEPNRWLIGGAVVLLLGNLIAELGPKQR